MAISSLWQYLQPAHRPRPTPNPNLNPNPTSIFNQPTGPGFVRFKTSSQNFFGQDTSSMAVGESNQGIVSAKTQNIHAAQAK